MLPMNVHEFGEFAQIAAYQRVPAFMAKMFGQMQIIQHLDGVVAGARILIAQNFSGGARRAREKQQ